MTLTLSEWLVVALYFVASAAIGLAYTRRASKSLADYFVSGRSLPWWLAGTSMVADSSKRRSASALSPWAAAE